MSAVVVGLDVATKTGWCRVDGDQVRTGVIDCTPTAKGEPEGVRYRRLAERIRPVLDGARTVVLEQPFSRGMRTAQVLGGLVAVALVQIEGLGLDYVFVPAPQLKSFGADHGVKGKAAMQAEAGRILGRDLTDDEADAWWLVWYWRERLS